MTSNEHSLPDSSRTLLSPPFLVAVVTLAINDHVLKRLTPNWVTGKLSDVAGLFAVTLFLGALLPRWRTAAALALSAGFIWWKSAASTVAINVFNDLGLWTIGRTIDATDLLALPAIPAALFWLRNQKSSPAVLHRALPRAAVAVLSVLVFAATSYQSTVPFSDFKYAYSGTRADLIKALQQQGIVVYESGDFEPAEIRIPSDFCFKSVVATVMVYSTADTTYVDLVEITHRCPRQRKEEELLRKIFEDKVAKPLGLRRVHDS